MSRQYTKFFITWNNPFDGIALDKTIEEVFFDSFRKNGINAGYGQLERGEEGTIHWQVIIQSDRSRRFAWIKRTISNSIHVENVADLEESKVYCSKEETRLCGPFEFGTFTVTGRGTRSDLQSAAMAIDEGLSLREIGLRYPTQWIRYHNGLSSLYRLRATAYETDYRVVRKIYIHGSSGTGKSRFIYEMGREGHLGTYWKFRGFSTLTPWFDGYGGENTLVLDEFRGRESGIDFGFLLEILDGYPLRLPVRHGYAYAAWTTVIVISNSLPMFLYQGEDTAPLYSRLSAERNGHIWNFDETLLTEYDFNTYLNIYNSI